MSRLRRALRDRDEREAGMTVTELIVAMGIFTVIVAVFMAGVVVMTRNTARAQAVADAGAAALKVFQRLDKEVRYSSGINAAGPGSTTGTVYVEYLVTAVEAGTTPKCTQWRYSATSRKLELRTWPNVTGASPTAWRTMATNVRNDLSVASQTPFVFTPADTVNGKQQLAVRLDIGPGAAGGRKGAQIDSVFVARNTSTLSQSNGMNPTTGKNTTPVCTQVGRP